MDGLYFIRSMLLLISALAESGLCVIGPKVQRRAADQQIFVPTSISSDNVQKQTRTIRKLRSNASGSVTSKDTAGRYMQRLAVAGTNLRLAAPHLPYRQRLPRRALPNF
jgi:hypothetical protein